jgi:hypothetical protein
MKCFPTDNKAIWGFLALEDGSGGVFFNVSSRLIVGGIYHS